MAKYEVKGRFENGEEWADDVESGNAAEEAKRKTSTAQIAAGARYDKIHTKQIMMKLNKGTDADIIEHLGTVGNVQGYIKALIRADMNK